MRAALVAPRPDVAPSLEEAAPRAAPPASEARTERRTGALPHEDGTPAVVGSGAPQGAAEPIAEP